MSGLAKALTEDQVLVRVMEKLHEQIYSQDETIKFLMDKRLEQRKWVELTDEEIGIPTEPIQPHEAIMFARVIEALIKGKNT